MQRSTMWVRTPWPNLLRGWRDFKSQMTCGLKWSALGHYVASFKTHKSWVVWGETEAGTKFSYLAWSDTDQRKTDAQGRRQHWTRGNTHSIFFLRNLQEFGGKAETLVVPLVGGLKQFYLHGGLRRLSWNASRLLKHETVTVRATCTYILEVLSSLGPCHSSQTDTCDLTSLLFPPSVSNTESRLRYTSPHA